jgi:hypothetical protein
MVFVRLKNPDKFFRPKLRITKKYYAATPFFKNHKSKHYAANPLFKKMRFYRVLYNYFLDIYKMSKKILNLLIMCMKKTIPTLIDFPT